ncbi:MAG: hypothetical protein ACREKB_13780 [Candidatus Rokuibacteriota bacterium]
MTDADVADVIAPAGRIDAYRVEPHEDGEGEWHILTFENGVQVQIYSSLVVIVQPEQH